MYSPEQGAGCRLLQLRRARPRDARDRAAVVRRRPDRGERGRRAVDDGRAALALELRHVAALLRPPRPAVLRALARAGVVHGVGAVQGEAVVGARPRVGEPAVAEDRACDAPGDVPPDAASAAPGLLLV